MLVNPRELLVLVTLGRPGAKDACNKTWAKSPLPAALMRSFPCALARVPDRMQTNTSRMPNLNECFRNRVAFDGIIETPLLSSHHNNLMRKSSTFTKDPLRHEIRGGNPRKTWLACSIRSWAGFR